MVIKYFFYLFILVDLFWCFLNTTSCWLQFFIIMIMIMIIIIILSDSSY